MRINYLSKHIDLVSEEVFSVELEMSPTVYQHYANKGQLFYL